MAVAPGLAGAAQRGHVVQFYAREWELAAGVGGYLAEALDAGCAVVVVATPAHRLAFESYLAGVDANVAAARADGRYHAIDAAALLHRFAEAGQVDPASFEAEVGQVIRAAGAGGRPVRLYGEMVALLWEAGQLNAALELEGLWNDLARDIPFGLYCGYPEAPADRGGPARRAGRGVPPARGGGWHASQRGPASPGPVPGDPVLRAGPGFPPGGPALRAGPAARLADRAALRREPGQ